MAVGKQLDSGDQAMTAPDQPSAARFTDAEVEAQIKDFEGRLTTVPKPGTEPFAPGPCGITMMAGGSPKAGDDAGYQQVNSAVCLGGAGIIGFSGTSQTWMVQGMVWALDPYYQRLAVMLRSLLSERQAIAVRGGQPCAGYPSCDGDLPGMQHDNDCPVAISKWPVRIWAYDLGGNSYWLNRKPDTSDTECEYLRSDLASLAQPGGWIAVTPESLPPRFTAILMMDSVFRSSGFLGEKDWHWDCADRRTAVPVCWAPFPADPPAPKANT